MSWLSCRHSWLFFRLYFFFHYSLKSLGLSMIEWYLRWNWKKGGKSITTPKKNKTSELAVTNLNTSSLTVTSENSDAIRDSNSSPARGFTACKTWFKKKVLTPLQAQYIFIGEAHSQLNQYHHRWNINPKVPSQECTAQHGRTGR